MIKDENELKRLIPLFGSQFCAGAIIFRANEKRELLFANDSIVQLFECADQKDFVEYVGGCYDGLINHVQKSEVIDELSNQIFEQKQRAGYVFYNIITKSGKTMRVVNHWSLCHDEKEGELIYSWIFLHKLDKTGFEFDVLTGLHTNISFGKNVKTRYRRMGKAGVKACVIIYINLINFKLLNIEQGSAKGDDCLKRMADILNDVFPNAVIARMSGDHFAVFTDAEDALTSVKKVKVQFDEAYREQFNLISKYGIYEFSTGQDLDVEEAISMAKMSCDFIKYDLNTDIMEYSFRLAKQVMTREYIVRKLDEALEKGWVKVYCQPVIRSLTGCLCGMESLTRWIDPEIGFLPPNEFIETLEQERQIHKLDSYVVDKVCAYIAQRLADKLPVVPVSVNFSRMDFVLCDMVEVVEKAVEKYDIPRDFIHIEITESMIASDEDLMTSVIKRFRDAGYEIWMDDFGSGYSSLTMLKDYSFDTLKMDMRFLTPFTDKSKSIMRATVSMAKDVGMKTLAEGVETEEQLEFLRDIGCGMIQGYYYGKPEPVLDVFLHLEEKSIPSESRSWRQFYENAGFMIRDTSTPLEIIEDDGEQFRTLYMNKAYRKQIFKDEDLAMDLEEIDRRIYHTASPLLSEYRKFADQIERSGEQETFYYTDNGNYLCFTGKLIAKNKGRYVISGSIWNLSKDESRAEIERIDNKLGELNHLFEMILWIQPDENLISPLLGNLKYNPKREKDGKKLLREVLDFIADEVVFPPENARYRKFVALDTLDERIASAEHGYVAEIFKFKQKDGSYRREEILIMSIPGTGAKEYLYCMKPYVLMKKEGRPSEQQEKEAADQALLMEYSGIWENILWKSRLQFYWKDTDRRFRGVSRSFMDYFGIESEDQILGKTEEEMGWLLHPEDVEKLENDILSKGAKYPDRPGQVLARGVVHEVTTSYMPIYNAGKVVGVLGRLEDMKQENTKLARKQESLRTDPITGLLNETAFKGLLGSFALEHRSSRKDYGLILMNNKAHERIAATYDEEFGDLVLQEITSVLRTIVGKSSKTARIKESIFAILVPVGDWLQLQGLVEELRIAVGAIRQVDDKPVTLRLQFSYKSITDESVDDDTIYETALNEVL